MNAQRLKSAFTLIEALVAVVVVAIAGVGSMHAFSSLTRGERKAQEEEYLQRLAYEKYDEEIAIAQQTLSNSSGNFDDRNLQGYSWSMDVASTSINDLMSVTVSVSKDSDGISSSSPKGIARGLYYQQQATSGTTGAAAGGTGG